MSSNLLNGNNLRNNEEIHTKFLIVGSGAGGAVASNLLNKYDKDTLVVEEGDLSKEIQSPYLSQNLNKWRNRGMIPIRSGTKIISYAEGSCVGGSTEINGALMWKTPEKILDNWEKKYQLENISMNKMAPYFNEYEKQLSISYQEEENTNNLSKKILEISETLGWSNEKVKRAQKGCKNTNQCPVGCPSGAKQTMSKTYIKNFLSEKGNLIYNSKILKIFFKKNIATKALAISSEGMKFYINFKYIFLSSGVIQTPILLFKSGIKKNIGNKFQIQPNLKIAVLFDKNIYPENGTMMTRQINEFSKDGFSIGGSNFSPSYLSMTIASAGKNALSFLEQWQKTALYISLMKFNGIGKIRLIPFTNLPYISYKIHKNDFEIMKKSILKMAEGFFSLGAKKIITPFKKFQIVESLNEVRDKILYKKNLEHVELSAVHGMSSCGMSGDPDKFESATGNYGELNGFQNIFIADASILPTSLGVNPQETISCLVMRNIDFFLNKNKHI